MKCELNNIDNIRNKKNRMKLKIENSTNIKYRKWLI